MYPPIYEISTFENISLPAFAANARQLVMPYIKDFLTDRHPYRNGAICPFVAGAIKNDDLYFSYGDHTRDQAWDSHIEHCLSFMESQRSTHKYGRSLIILFPEDFSVEVLLRIHVRNKIRCVNAFFMLGALYKNSNARSLHSDQFFPLRTPSPTLVIREITAGDLMFLEPSHYDTLPRLKFLKSFIKRFDIQTASKYELQQVQLARSKSRQYIKNIIWAVTRCIGVISGVVTLAFIFLGG